MYIFADSLATALITGQDGSYAAELLLEKQYRVVGVVRKNTASAAQSLAHGLAKT